jgi:putative membrane protein
MRRHGFGEEDERGIFSVLVSWLSEGSALVAAHMLGNVVWVGSLLAAGLLAAHAPWTAEPSEVGRLARRVYMRLAVPGFLVSFGTGVARIALAPAAYLHLPWFHAKLTFAVLIIVFHHVIGARAKQIAKGRTAAAAGVDFQAVAVLLCAAGAVLFGIAKSLP